MTWLVWFLALYAAVVSTAAWLMLCMLCDEFNGFLRDEMRRRAPRPERTRS